jgi:alpha-glucosidase
VLVDEDEDVAFHGTGDDKLHLVFNFPLLRVDRLTPAHLRANQAVRLAELPPGAWPCNTLGNHDTRRVWSCYGDGLHDAELARLPVTLILTLKGTPFLYNGEEIGMSDLVLADLRQLRDTMSIFQYHTLIEQLGKTPEEALSAAIESTRDRCRSPMQWSAEPNSGFSPPDVQPWLPVNATYTSGINVAAQIDDPASLLSFYRRLLHVRRSTPALVAGDDHALHAHSDDYFAFLRHDDASGQTCLVVFNFTDAAQTVIFDPRDKQPRLLFSSHPRDDQPLALDWLALAPFEVLIVELV